MGSYVRDHFGAVSLSVLLHVAIGLAMVFGLTLGRARVARAPQPSAIEVVMVSEDPTAVVAARLEAQRREQQRLEEQRIESERREQERVEREREQQRRLAAEREAEARRAEQARVELEQQQREEAERIAVERERREAEEAERREAERLAEQQRLEEERRREEERLAEERRLEEERRREEERLAEQRRQEEARRAQEERERQLMEAELQAALTAEQELMEARRSGEFDRYVRQIQTAIEQAWIPPASAREGLECIVNVTQIPSGDVITVDIGRCNGDEAVRRSIEAAVLRASPLPTPEIAALFNRNLQVIFKPQF
jgi:colicin import membrane protein